MSVTLLAATTDADDTSEFRIRGTKDKITIMCQPALAGSEECDLEQSVDGTNWHKVDIGALTASVFAVTVTNPGHYRVAKDATAGATGVFCDGKCALL